MKIDSGLIMAIIGVIGTLLGTILGWALNCIQERRNNRIKLCFSLRASGLEDELIKEELRTKYSESGYCMQIYNIGQIPFLFDIFLCSIKKQHILIALIQRNKMQYYHIRAIFIDSVCRSMIQFCHCKKEKLKECEVVAYDISGKKSKGRLDLILSVVQAELNNINFRTRTN
jgi:hypothetical protein